MVVYGAGKERIFVSIYSAAYLSNFVTFFESRDVVWRQNYDGEGKTYGPYLAA
jgi:hypothetical protein